MMLGVAMLLEAEPPRIVRGMGEYWIPQLPFVSVARDRAAAARRHARELRADARGRRVRDGVPGRRARHEQAVPRALQAPALRARASCGSRSRRRRRSCRSASSAPRSSSPASRTSPRLGTLLGMPAFPITLAFPWLGPLGILPLPVKYRIHFGEPLRFDGAPTEEDAAIEARGRRRCATRSTRCSSAAATSARGSSVDEAPRRSFLAATLRCSPARALPAATARRRVASAPRRRRRRRAPPRTSCFVSVAGLDARSLPRGRRDAGAGGARARRRRRGARRAGRAVRAPTRRTRRS